MPYDRIFFKQLFLLCLFFLIGIQPSSANRLKDIRVGEYKDFMRIVFEFDTEMDAALRVSTDDDRVRIDFPASRPDLVRKIPIENTNHIRKIQLWNNAEQFSAIVDLTTPQRDVKWFALKNPPRRVMDIFWKEAPRQNQAAVASTVTSDKTLPEFEPEPLRNPPGDRPAVQPQESSDAVPASGPSAPPALKNEPALPEGPSASASIEGISEQRIPPADRTILTATAERATKNNPKRSNWMQYYLVLALIIMTITILFLLALILLTQYRWITNKIPLRSNEHLKKQDNRIAELNERIKEQLKRYDEA